MEKITFNKNEPKDISPLIQAIGEAPVVMLGEASHGTSEYYLWRSAITKKLIQEKGFSFIAVEGDWPDCYSINRFIKNYPDSGDYIIDILNSFNRWPTWMWANWEIAALGEWLRDYNSRIPLERRVGFYGLDVYSLWESMHAMVPYLDKEDPNAAKAVRQAIRCFEPYREEGQLYSHAVSYRSKTCQDEVLALLKEVRMKAKSYDMDREATFNAEQNARIVVDAENYYRSMISFNDDSWNIRDTHMMDTLKNLMNFHGPKAKGIIWEHNTHVGDARATDMTQVGMINIGQLAREHYGEENVFLVGFGSFQGKVIAGSEWDAPMEEMPVPPAKEDSIEHYLHKHENTDLMLLFNHADEIYNSLVPHRAIGVVYHPGREKYGNYVPSVLSERYNAFIFIDETTAIHPLHIQPEGQKVPQTYPFGL